MNLSYIISSHVSYQAPRRALVASMLAYGIAPERIVAVIGGGKPPATAAKGCPEELFVEHNSYDFTGMVWLIESLRGASVPTPTLEANRFVFLHDTMIFGERSDELFASAETSAWATAAEPDAQCNLVCYHRDYLESRANDILSLKSCDKLAAINFERHFWRSCPEERRSLYPQAECLLLGEGYPYDGVLRRQEYYPAVDITKWKANWGQSMENLITSP